MTLWLRQQPTITLDLAIQGMQPDLEQAQLLSVKVSGCTDRPAASPRYGPIWRRGAFSG